MTHPATSSVPHHSTNREAALELLAKGATATETALTLGVSDGLISQFMSEDDFAAQLATLRFEALKKNNARDEALDELEDQLIKQLKTAASMAIRPMEVSRLFQIVNSAKRRGGSAAPAAQTQQTVVKLVIPVAIMNRFAVNSKNQVIEAGDQQLITIQSGNIEKMAAEILPTKEVRNDNSYQQTGHSRELRDLTNYANQLHRNIDKVDFGFDD